MEGRSQSRRRHLFFARECSALYIEIDDKEGLRKLIAESRALSPELCDGIERALIVDDGSIEIDEIGGYEPISQAKVAGPQHSSRNHTKTIGRSGRHIACAARSI